MHPSRLGRIMHHQSPGSNSSGTLSSVSSTRSNSFEVSPRATTSARKTISQLSNSSPQESGVRVYQSTAYRIMHLGHRTFTFLTMVQAESRTHSPSRRTDSIGSGRNCGRQCRNATMASAREVGALDRDRAVQPTGEQVAAVAIAITRSRDTPRLGTGRTHRPVILTLAAVLPVPSVASSICNHTSR